MTYVSIVDEKIKSLTKEIITLKKKMDDLIKEVKFLRNELKKTKNKEIQANIKQKESEIKELKRKIFHNYHNLMKFLNQKLDNAKLSEIDEEEFIEPEGLCEAISIGLQFKRTQLRKFFSEIKNIKTSFQNSEADTKKIRVQVVSLIPKLAYAASPSRNLIDEDFYQFMKTLLEKLKEELTYENFKKFEQIIEAIIAYHTYHHPKED